MPPHRGARSRSPAPKRCSPPSSMIPVLASHWLASRSGPPTRLRSAKTVRRHTLPRPARDKRRLSRNQRNGIPHRHRTPKRASAPHRRTPTHPTSRRRDLPSHDARRGGETAQLPQGDIGTSRPGAAMRRCQLNLGGDSTSRPPAAVRWRQPGQAGRFSWSSIVCARCRMAGVNLPCRPMYTSISTVVLSGVVPVRVAER
jgi:hypothetical protein